MPTRAQIRDDIYLRIKPKPSDDDNLYARHIDAMIDRYRSLFVRKEVAESQNHTVDPSLLSLYENNTCTVLANTNQCYTGYKLFTFVLPSTVVDLPKDTGVYRVCSTAGKLYRRIDKRDLNKFLKIPMATVDHTFYREGNVLFLIKKLDIKEELAKSTPKIDLDLVIADTIGTGDPYLISDTSNYPISESIASMIIESIVQQQAQSQQMPSDYINDGVDE